MDDKKIIILGTGGTAKFCDFSCETWGVNGAYTWPRAMPEEYRDRFRIDKLFFTDFLFSVEGAMNFCIEELNSLKEKYGTELIGLHEYKIGKHRLRAKHYPYQRIYDWMNCIGDTGKEGECAAKIHKMGSDYFTDSICYIIAYAIYIHSDLAINENGIIRAELKHPLTLRLYGVDMKTTYEYQVSKGGIEWWLGIARGIGCNIEVSLGQAPGQSAILYNPRGFRYGTRPKFDLNKIDPQNILGRKGRRKYEPRNTDTEQNSQSG